MIQEQNRAEFEAFIVEEAERRNYKHMDQVLKRDPSDEYSTTWVDMAWMGWEASRRLLEIDFTDANTQYASWNQVDCYAIPDIAVILKRYDIKAKL